MISVVISAYNEEKNIKSCIESVQGLADEVLVVDNSSTDKTAEISKSLGAKVIKQKNNPKRIDLQKNFGFENASNEWILSLDADERVTPLLADEIRKTILKHKNINGFEIPRKNIIFGKWIRHSLWWPDYQLRLFKKGKGKFLNSTVHVPMSIKGDTMHLSEPLVHESYASISQFVNRMNNIYTEVEAEEILRKNKDINWVNIISLPISDFLKTFFLQKGYRDGLHGLTLSLLQSFYMFLVYAKVWEGRGFYDRDRKEVLIKTEREFLNVIADFRFWFISALKNETRNPFKKITYIFLRIINNL